MVSLFLLKSDEREDRGLLLRIVNVKVCDACSFLHHVLRGLE